MIKYKDIIKQAQADGVTSESAMWLNVDQLDKMLETLSEEHPAMYQKFIRKTHASLYGNHYNECFALEDVADMHSTDKDGIVKNGEHWSVDEVRVATIGKTFPQGTTDWDRYVAYNAMWHDLRKQFADDDVAEAAYLFFFDDEDACDGKIWCYQMAMNKCRTEE